MPCPICRVIASSDLQIYCLWFAVIASSDLQNCTLVWLAFVLPCLIYRVLASSDLQNYSPVWFAELLRSDLQSSCLVWFAVLLPCLIYSSDLLNYSLVCFADLLRSDLQSSCFVWFADLFPHLHSSRLVWSCRGFSSLLPSLICRVLTQSSDKENFGLNFEFKISFLKENFKLDRHMITNAWNDNTYTCSICIILSKFLFFCHMMILKQPTD